MTYDMDDEMVTVEVQEVVANHGTIVEFLGIDSNGREVRFGVDHRPAREMIDMLYSEGPFPAMVEDWQIIGFG